MPEPIFLIGTGRSGTTILYRLLTCHPSLAWVSNLTDRAPWATQLAVVNRFFDPSARGRIRPSVESPRTLAYCGFTQSQLTQLRRPLTIEDIPRDAPQRLRGIVKGHETWMNRPRFVLKSTANTMRVRALAHIFPNAYFVHIIRHPGGVANSLMNVGWWPILHIWWLGMTPREWEAEGRDPYELCALQWRREIQAALDSLSAIGQDHYIQIRYEDLLNDPLATVKHLASSLALPRNEQFEGRSTGLLGDSGRAWRWRTQLPDDAKRTIQRVAAPLLQDLGYAG